MITKIPAILYTLDGATITRTNVDGTKATATLPTSTAHQLGSTLDQIADWAYMHISNGEDDMFRTQQFALRAAFLAYRD